MPFANARSGAPESSLKCETGGLVQDIKSSRRHRLTGAALTFVLVVAIFTPCRGEDTYRSLFCTLRSADGGIYTARLGVPRQGSGPCQVFEITRTIISGPQPSTTSFAYVGTFRESYTTNFPGTPIRGALTPTPLAQVFAVSRLKTMRLKDLGSLTTVNGTTYPDSRSVTFQKDGVIVLQGNGVSRIRLNDLDEVSRSRVESARAK
jgi:hypothetical protein